MENHAKHVVTIVGDFDQNCQSRVEEWRCEIHVFGPIKIDKGFKKLLKIDTRWRCCIKTKVEM